MIDGNPFRSFGSCILTACQQSSQHCRLPHLARLQVAMTATAICRSARMCFRTVWVGPSCMLPQSHLFFMLPMTSSGNEMEAAAMCGCKGRSVSQDRSWHGLLGSLSIGIQNGSSLVPIVTHSSKFVPEPVPANADCHLVHGQALGCTGTSSTSVCVYTSASP